MYIHIYTHICILGMYNLHNSQGQLFGLLLHFLPKFIGRFNIEVVLGTLFLIIANLMFFPIAKRGIVTSTTCNVY